MNSSNTNNTTFAIHSVSLKGKRPHNEDKHNVITNKEGQDPNKMPINYFGIYDGHGGKFVSKFLHDNLPTFFFDKRMKYPVVKKVIYSTYDYIENILKKKYLKHTMHCGSTCLVVINYRVNNINYLNVLNTGDTRAVLCRGNIAIPLTKDHKPDWPDERKRIEELGGKIYKDGPDWRIKDLSVSRAFCDFDAEPFVTSKPDIFKYKLDSNDNFLIMACDGLWDVLSNQDAVNFVINSMDSKKQKINIARKLGEYAIKLGSMDNVTIIIIFFK